MLSGKLPVIILNRQKQEFSFPVSLWLQGSLTRFYEEILSTTAHTCGRLLNYDYLRCLLDEHRSAKMDHGRRLSNAMIFIYWYDSLRKN